MNTPIPRMPHVSPRRLRQLRRTMSTLQAISPRLAACVGLTLFITPVRRKLDAADVPWLGVARHHTVMAGSDAVHVYEWGTGRRTVVILHGWGSHAPRFSLLAQSLVSSGWRVLAIDAPGHGRSPGRTSSLPQFMAALDAVVRTHGPVHSLVGHSLGALASVLWLGRQDSASRADVGHLVLISSPTSARFLIDNFISMLGLNDEVARQLVTRFTSRFGGKPEAWSAPALAAGIRVPVLLIHDRADDVIPFAHSEQLLAALPNARLHATTGLGHSGMLRDATTVSIIDQELAR